jgi:hypothetical protein
MDPLHIYGLAFLQFATQADIFVYGVAAGIEKDVLAIKPGDAGIVPNSRTHNITQCKAPFQETFRPIGRPLLIDMSCPTLARDSC